MSFFLALLFIPLLILALAAPYLIGALIILGGMALLRRFKSGSTLTKIICLSLYGLTIGVIYICLGYILLQNTGSTSGLNTTGFLLAWPFFLFVLVMAI